MDFDGIKKKASDGLAKVMDIVFPLPTGIEEEDETAVDVVKAEPAVKADESLEEENVETLKVANGGTIIAGGASSSYTSGTGSHYGYGSQFGHKTHSNRPQLTVHTTKVAKLSVLIYAPEHFDQVPRIADDLKAGKAAIVNFGKVEPEEQRRLCDFVNGVCYVLDGSVKRITGKIVFYAPKGVDIEEAVAALPD